MKNSKYRRIDEINKRIVTLTADQLEGDAETTIGNPNTLKLCTMIIKRE